MSSTPLAQLLAGVPALNGPQNDFVYTVVGDTVVGTWNIVSAKFVDLDATAGTIDKDYSITVTFNEKKERFDFSETRHDSSTHVGLDSNGGLSIGGEKEFFKGKSTSKEFSFTFGGANKTAAGVSPVLSYKFETSLIKDPLFGYLKQNGWKAKSGWFNH
jgi:hypothetical protein